ncbi:YczE/YyaS/YitT family protein [Clostridium cellulovorans]|uniref:Integral membrane protein n=1 Tax=Clostridium cellulovorans (strain ATCC 35296 / DSM 3052 / OCM 3 / 743B) TaxID=573061 RepID=D9SNI5_CLOC7|nr:DUF6198 family protein [Clostridium cellulovorans]ADL53977.1 protein of unknown function DUF161 [Clostridium cellulovorans 743B]
MKYILRITIYFAGLFLLAIGINLAIKSNLGVSPVSAFPLAISNIIGVSLGTVTIGVYAFYVLAQALILRKKFKLKSLLQILFSFPFGFFVDFASGLLKGIEASNYFIQVLLMSTSIGIVSIGVVMFITMDIVPNAPDGLVLAISDKTKTDFGKVKILFDCTSVILAIILSLVFIGNISTIREGTIISALLTGKVIGIISKPCAPRLKKLVFNDSDELIDEIVA